jgi:hypothetical protein
VSGAVFFSLLQDPTGFGQEIVEVVRALAPERVSRSEPGSVGEQLGGSIGAVFFNEVV